MKLDNIWREMMEKDQGLAEEPHICKGGGGRLNNAQNHF
jgi:hypothetical protein